jgi:hypothetical protein
MCDEQSNGDEHGCLPPAHPSSGHKKSSLPQKLLNAAGFHALLMSFVESECKLFSSHRDGNFASEIKRTLIGGSVNDLV